MPQDPTNPLEGDPRVYFAAERTLLAWIRTGLALMGFGFVVARFGLFLREVYPVAATQAATPGHGRFSAWVGMLLVVIGVAVNLMAAGQHLRFLRRFRRGDPLELAAARVPAGVVLSIVLGVIGVATAAYLLYAVLD